MILKKAEDAAKELLESLEITSLPIPIEKIASKLKLSVMPYEFGSSVSGALFVKNGVATIGINPTESKVRRRFTIAHELGHFLLHKNEQETLFIDKKVLFGHFRDEESSTGERKKEREANAFAAALLMPTNILKKEIDNIFEDDHELTDEEAVKTLSNRFEVSQMAMSFRLSNLGILNS